MIKTKSLIFSVLSLLVFSCNSGNIKNIGAEEFYKIIEKEAQIQLIDVRTPQEFAGSKIEGAINVPINSPDFQNLIANLSKEKIVLVYCLSGSRSVAAANYLQENGFKEVYNLTGGLLEWQSANLTVNRAQAEGELQGLSLEKFKNLTSGSKPVLVDFYAEWCGPCKQMEPSLKEIVAENPDNLTLLRIDVDKNSELATALQIEGIPLFHIYKNDKLTWQNMGMVSKNTIVENL